MIRKSIGQETKGCNRPWKIPLPKAILCSQWTMLLPPSCHCCKYIGHHAILLTQSLAKSCFVGRSWNTSFLSIPITKDVNQTLLYCTPMRVALLLQLFFNVFLLRFCPLSLSTNGENDGIGKLCWPTIGPQKVVDWEVYCLYLNICLQIFKA